MRIELNDVNSEKAQAHEKQLRDQGIVMSPNQIVNICYGAIEIASLKQIVELTMKVTDKSGIVHRRSVRSQTNWVMGGKM